MNYKEIPTGQQLVVRLKSLKRLVEEGWTKMIDTESEEFGLSKNGVILSSRFYQFLGKDIEAVSSNGAVMAAGEKVPREAVTSFELLGKIIDQKNQPYKIIQGLLKSEMHFEDNFRLEDEGDFYRDVNNGYSYERRMVEALHNQNQILHFSVNGNKYTLVSENRYRGTIFQASDVDFIAVEEWNADIITGRKFVYRFLTLGEMTIAGFGMNEGNNLVVFPDGNDFLTTVKLYSGKEAELTYDSGMKKFYDSTGKWYSKYSIKSVVKHAKPLQVAKNDLIKINKNLTLGFEGTSTILIENIGLEKKRMILDSISSRTLLMQLSKKHGLIYE